MHNLGTIAFAVPGMASLIAQADGTAAIHSWSYTIFVALLAFSLAANLFGMMWSLWRELHVRKLNDTVIEAIHNGGDALKAIRASLCDVCKRIDEDRSLERDAKLELHAALRDLEQRINNHIQLLANMDNGRVTFNNMQNDGSQGVIGGNDGGMKRN